MKKILVALVLLVITGACKKEYNCECVITNSGTVTTRNQTAGFPPLVAAGDNTSSEPYSHKTESVETYDKVSKGNMRSACPVSAEEEVFEQNKSSSPGTFTITITTEGKKVRECEIK